MISLEEMLSLIKAYNPDCNTQLLAKAYNFCVEAHTGQYRKSGESYHTHPIAVAKYVIDMKLDDATIITALLHDVLEDTAVTYNKLVNTFSVEIANLVDGVSKLDKINYKPEHIKQAENFRKLFLALSRDIRILIVKLCDRLHNMLTLGYHSRYKRKIISIETLEIFVPLAERIGMYTIKDELQDLAFSIINNRARNSIIRRLEQLTEQYSTEDFIKIVTTELGNLLSNINIPIRITSRTKKPYSIWKKLISKNITLDKVSDLIGFRIITATVEDCYKILGKIHTTYKAIPGSFIDYISIPKLNGYRSIHTSVLGPRNQRIEIQIRTEEMNSDAEYGLASHWQYKQGINTIISKRDGMVTWINRMLAMLKESGSAEEFLEATKLEMYEEQIFAFTAKGDIIPLPLGSTVIDFAFAIHTDLGLYCNGANINGIRVEPYHILKNGDQVEVITSKAAWPHLDWLKHAITGSARAAIRKATKLEQIEEQKSRGKAILYKVFESYSRIVDENVIEEIKDKCSINKTDDLYINIAKGTIDIVGTVKKIFPEFEKIKQKKRKISKANDGDEKNFIKQEKEINHYLGYDKEIIGLDPRVKTIRCKCCNPSYENSIKGIIIPNIGVYIHSINCNVLKSMYIEPCNQINHLYWAQ